jgi:methyl-accepting chemotaxis protein
MKLTIRRKLFVLVAIIITTYGLAVGFILINFKNKLTEDAKQLTIAQLNKNASSASAIINGDFKIARTMASTLTETIALETSIREDVTGKILDAAVKQDKRYLSTWLSMELSAIDPNWTRPYGRKRYTYYQSGDPVFDTVNMDGDVPGSLYFNLKQSKAEELTEPYLLSSTSEVKDARNEYLGTSVCVPLIQNGEFIGLAGTDITLEALDFIARFKPFPGSTSFLVSNEGVIVSHEDLELIGEKLTRIIAEDTSALFSQIKTGKASSWISAESGALIAFTPLKIGSSSHYWSIGTMVPMTAITSSINNILYKTMIISVIGLIILVISVYLISGKITKPINLVNQRLKELAKGHIRSGQNLKALTNDEIGEMVESVNTLVNNISEKVNFAVAIGGGKFETEFAPSGTEDTLGTALQTMRFNLKQFREEEDKRKWSNEGLAKVNDVLRMTFATTELFYFNALKTLITFLGANQGGLFLVDEDEAGDKHIDLVAAYAYERQKFLNRRLPWGANLVGQCILEKETVYLKQVPKDYVKITSGLGEATPGVLIIVPLKTDTETVGAIELATFNEFMPHELEFIERACDIIAASIFAYRNTARTKALLEKAQAAESEEKNKLFFN